VLDALVEEAIAQASKHLKIGARFPSRTLTRDFIGPVLELQKQYPAPLVQQALTITIRHKKLPGELRRGSWNRGWWKYAAAICEKKSGAERTRTTPMPSAPTTTRPSLPKLSRPDPATSTPRVAQPTVSVIRIKLDSAHDNVAWLGELRLICAPHPERSLSALSLRMKPICLSQPARAARRSPSVRPLRSSPLSRRSKEHPEDTANAC